MPLQAPTVDSAAPTQVQLSVRMIDVSGDLRTVSVKGAIADMTDANINTFVTAIAAATNASVYEVQVTQLFSSLASPGNALDASKSSSVYDNVVLQNKNALGDSINGFIPAPISNLFETDIDGNVTDNVDAAATEYTDVATALEALLPAGFSNTGVRYSERREVNSQQRL
jgi:hypothetical protein